MKVFKKYTYTVLISKDELEAEREKGNPVLAHVGDESLENYYDQELGGYHFSYMVAASMLSKEQHDIVTKECDYFKPLGEIDVGE